MGTTLPRAMAGGLTQLSVTRASGAAGSAQPGHRHAVTSILRGMCSWHHLSFLLLLFPTDVPPRGLRMAIGTAPQCGLHAGRRPPAWPDVRVRRGTSAAAPLDARARAPAGAWKTRSGKGRERILRALQAAGLRPNCSAADGRSQRTACNDRRPVFQQNFQTRAGGLRWAHWPHSAHLPHTNLGVYFRDL